MLLKLKKIIIYFPNFQRGGIENTSVLLTNYFTSKKIKVEFVTNSTEKKLFKLNKYLKILKSNKSSENFILSNIYSSIELYKILKKAENKNTVVLSLKNSIFSIIISKICKFKIVTRSSAPIDYFKFNENFFDKFRLLLKMSVYKFSDLIISNSKKSAKKIFINLNSQPKVLAISNPLKNTQNKISLKKKNYFLYVGRLSKEKGIYELINSFELFYKLNQKYKLMIIGKGQEQNKLKNYIKDKKSKKNIFFLDWKKNLSNYYKYAKIFILPSYFEGFGNVLIEALSYGTPCISTKSDGPVEILSNNRYGLIIKNNNPKNICSAIEKVLKNYNLFTKKAKDGHISNTKYDHRMIGQKYLNKLNGIL